MTVERALGTLLGRVARRPPGGTSILAALKDDA